MGSCFSVPQHQKFSATKFHTSYGSTNNNLVIPSPVKHKSPALYGGDSTIANVALKSHWSPDSLISTLRDSGSKEETFFDSQPWLESDCEDDFFSVKGDFTPSRGSSPVHPSFAVGSLAMNKSLAAEGIRDSIPAESASDKKKRLSELFEERLQVDRDIDEQNTEVNKNWVDKKTNAEADHILPSKSASGAPYISGTNSGYSSERTPNVAHVKAEDKAMRSAECCIPRFLSSRSCNERKKMVSPALNVG